MTILFDRHLDVHYRFVYLEGLGSAAGSDFGRAGQVNGLLGAGVPHRLSMTTGLHTGSVAFRVEQLEDEPPLPGSDWADVVEASVDLPGTALWLSAFDDGAELSTTMSGWHRARYSCLGFAAGADVDTVVADETAPDEYMLQLWPAPPAADRVVRVSGSAAQYWHDAAQERTS